ncbi:type II toxin-antitoxin system HigB family toxin [Roseicyclus persicicus]|uniref:Type II toxin-antitoxin system HigB family toxin n=1 Tax=Roseicyclus persicicus TaxID=2650661 RepID=A0A7X6JXD1_9RHOB|nr:type II toxin-antitoxin system HigB family toxin [Roseibacterium persicicum]NKX43274.1 type II toxin-antitoxin system HigB family toxin [Roseibacterium persicicum]
MRVLSKRTLVEFWTRHAAARAPLQFWYEAVSAARWDRPQDVKDQFGSTVDFVGDSRIVFDIGGNKFRLVARVVYAPYHRVMVKFVGTHAEYDKIDVEKI